MRRPPAPTDFVALSGSGAATGAFGFVRPAARAFVEAELAAHGSLAAAIGRWPDPVALVGRGGILAARPPVEDGSGRWVVRPYRRGGWMAPLLGDRHLALGTPRPWTETRAAQALEDAGIETPAVVAAVVYPAQPWYRAELVTRFVADARDLAAALFGPDPERDADVRRTLLRAAGAMAARLSVAGVLHRDFNAKNLLVLPTGGLAVLDLDRARVGPVDGQARRAMTSRLARSLGSFEARTGTVLPADEWAAFHHAARTNA